MLRGLLEGRALELAQGGSAEVGQGGSAAVERGDGELVAAPPSDYDPAEGEPV